MCLSVGWFIYLFIYLSLYCVNQRDVYIRCLCMCLCIRVCVCNSESISLFMCFCVLVLYSCADNGNVFFCQSGSFAQAENSSLLWFLLNGLFLLLPDMHNLFHCFIYYTSTSLDHLHILLFSKVIRAFELIF